VADGSGKKPVSTHWKERLPLHAGVWFHILLLLALAGPVAAATITIDPSTPGGIAGAITAAGAGDTIILNPGTYTENGITVSKNLSIRANTTHGHGYADTIIDGSNAGRILAVNALVTLTLDNLTLTRGNAGAGSGGAIRNSDTLTVTNVHFTSCTAASGGTIDNPGTATITASEFSSCSAPYGGAIVNGGTMSVQTSVFSGCSATGTSGGAIYNGGTIPSIKSTVFSGCTANTNGGAINNFNTGTITSIQFSRFYNNNAGTSGKAIYKLPFAGTITDTSDNWWGTNTDPAGVLSNVDTYVPYLLLNASAFPPSLTSAQTTVVQANLTYDSTGTGTIASGHIPDGTTVTFAVMSGPGSVSPASNTTKNGAAETTFTPSGAGTTNISATVDGQTVFTTVTTTWGVPVVTGITPASGSTSGGTVVTITGFGFSGATAVNFGAAASSGFTVNSNTRITATSPAGAAGSIDITVTTPGGTSATAPADRFTYAVIRESPASLPGGTTTGSGSDDYSGPGTSVTPGTITVNVGGNTAVHQATVTGTGLSGLIVTGTGQATAGPEVPPPSASCTSTSISYRPGSPPSPVQQLSSPSRSRGLKSTILPRRRS